MNSIRTTIKPLQRLFDPKLLLGALALASAMSASAAEKSYRYYQFKTSKLVGNGVNLQLSEFDFYRGATKLNINNKDTTGVNVVPATASSAGVADGAANEGPSKLLDGNTGTKLFRPSALVAGNELVFDFGATLPHPTIDSYTFTSATDSANFIRTPQTWILSGSDDGTTWTPIDSQVDAITTLANTTVYGPYFIPDLVNPLISSFAVHQTPLPGTPAIVLNGQSVTLDWNVQFATQVQLLTPQNPSGSVVAAVGSQVVTPPINSTAAYTLVGTKDDAIPAASTTLVRTVIGGAKTYRYVRYQITQRRGGFNGTNMVQVSEFEFYNGDATVAANKVTIVGATNAGGNNLNADQVAAKLFDGSIESKWLDDNNRAVVFDFGTTPRTFDRYLFVTGGDAADRDPIQWTLEGSNDLTRWDQIENVDFNYPTPEARRVSSLAIPLPGASLPLRLEYFTGDSPTVVAGQPLFLSYSTQQAVSVSIVSDNPSETLPPSAQLPLFGSIQVTPTVDTTYILTATGADGSELMAGFSVTIVADPGFTDIAFTDFNNAGPALIYGGTTLPTISTPQAVNPNRLRLTEEAQGRSGTAWFVKKLDGRNGFEATFGMSMNQTVPNNFAPADGLAFVVQNSPQGTSNPGTGENGVSEKALNICFRSFGFGPDPASKVEVRSGTTVLASAITFNTPGLKLYGIPGVTPQGALNYGAGFPYTLGSLATDPPYNIRIVYIPGDLDVYIDGIAVIQNVNVNLSTIGAADTNGKSYFGFTARTGGNVQANEITSWKVRLGNFAQALPFSSVKNLFRYTIGTPGPTRVDLVWNATAGRSYIVYKSLDLEEWEVTGAADGINGQVGIAIDIPTAVGTAPKAFFRVHEQPIN